MTQNKFNKNTKLFLILSLLLILLAFSGCKKKKEEGLLGGTQEKAIGVDVYVVKKVKSTPVHLEYPGITRSYKHAVVRARISGTLEKVLFKEGSFVKKGTPLFVIERELYLAEYKAAKAGLLQAMAQLYRAETTWERIKKSYAEHLVSKQTRDDAYAQYKLAKAGVKLAKAKFKQAKIYLSYTIVKAPISGITSERKVDPGNLVSPGTPLVEINQVNPIYVKFSIPDEDIFKYHFLDENSDNYIKKLKVRLKFSNGSVYPELGKIDYVSSVLNKGIPSLNVRAVFPNEKRKVLPNLFVRVDLIGITRKNVILVPKRSIMYAPEGAKVYVIKNGIAVEKFIKISGEYKDFYIVEKGLNPGDKVIIDNLMRLTSGKKVRVLKVVGK